MWEAIAPKGPGPCNAITDVEGVTVGHHHRIGDGWMTGVTVVLATAGAVASVDVRGGGPGTRETDLLHPSHMVEKVQAVCLCGGSAYGLAAADGVMTWLAERGFGFTVGTEPHEVVPIVPAAVLFDLKAGDWGKRPDASFGYQACEAAGTGAVAQGCVGAGTGAQAGPLKGGIGTASTMMEDGTMVGALVAVNARGHVIDPATGTPWASHLGFPGEFALQAPHADDVAAAAGKLKPTAKMPKLNTTIGVVATNGDLTKAECHRLAIGAHDGLARAVRPAHTLFDGDTIFALATGTHALELKTTDSYDTRRTRGSLVNDITAAAADAFGRACVHALLAATPLGSYPSYRDVWPSSQPA
jgi:L-aminopeptidase/D-esterase-like protein